METSKKIDLILQNLDEFVGSRTVLEKIVDTRPLKIYWGTAPTGQIHIGYLVPLLKIVDFVDAGSDVIILIADIHAMLDNQKTTPEQLEPRTAYYITLIKHLLTSLKVDLGKVRFIKGSDYQMKSDYVFDMYKINTTVTVNTALHAGSGVTKQQGGIAHVTDLLYPTMQVLDEKYLGVDAELGGIDQRKIFMLSKDLTALDKKHKAKFHMMNKILPSLSKTEPSDQPQKMSASDGDKIDILDGKKIINKKIKSVYCLEGRTDKNPILDICEIIVFRILQRSGKPFYINRDIKYNPEGDLSFDNFESLKQAFGDKLVHPTDLKIAVGSFFSTLFEPIRTAFDDKQMKQLLNKAYPIKLK